MEHSELISTSVITYHVDNIVLYYELSIYDNILLFKILNFARMLRVKVIGNTDSYAYFKGKKMKLTSKGRYAVMALVDLARFDNINPVSLRDISLRQGISLDYLEQIFLKLRKNPCSFSELAFKEGGNYVELYLSRKSFVK